MKTAIVNVTGAGAAVAKRIFHALESVGIRCGIYSYSKYPIENSESFDILSELTPLLFTEYDGLIFVCACGIAVRAISPLVASKCTDPAVIAVDIDGRYVIPLLSGHIGGANRLAEVIAEKIGAVPVITTATDVGGLFSVDSFATANFLYIADMNMAKCISAAVLNRTRIGLYSDYPYKNTPAELSEGEDFDIGVCISENIDKKPFAKTLNLVPQRYVIGIGCKRGTRVEAITALVKRTLREHNIPIYSVRAAATVDIKKNENGLLLFCKENNLPLFTYSAEELMRLDGEFSSSEFVKKTVGADNVCERSAALCSGGEILVRKTAENGVTLAIAQANVEIDFERKLL